MSRARPVRSERLGVRGKRRTIKRDCETGTFVPTATRANNCGAPRARAPARDPYLPRPEERYDAACYPSRAQAVRAFVDRNRDVLDAGGGLYQRATGGEYDAMNERYKPRRPVATMAEAIALAADGDRGHHCLTDFDLRTLNELPGCAGLCTLPDAAYEAEPEALERDYYERRRAEAAEEVPF